jgi:uncharacterized protein
MTLAPNTDSERAAEAALDALGIADARVHAHGEVARIEIPAAQLEALAAPGRREAALAAVRAVGFRFVAIDLGALG